MNHDSALLFLRTFTITRMAHVPDDFIMRYQTTTTPEPFLKTCNQYEQESYFLFYINQELVLSLRLFA